MKRKRSPAQRRASMANLAKTRRKRAGAAAPKKRRAKRATPKRKRARAAAPRKHRKHVRRRARAQAAAPRRARRRARRGARDNYQDQMTLGIANKNSELGKAWRKANKKRGGSVKKKKKASRRRGRRVTSRTSTHKKRRKQRKRHFRTVRTGRHAGKRRVNRRRSRRHLVRGYTTKHGKRIKRHMSYEAGAMENPLSTGEVVVVGLLGVLGAVVAQGADRFLATHALTGTVAADGAGLTDSPGKGQDYNANSVNAPMGLVRWAVAGGLSIVPIVAAHYIKSPMGRTSLQAVGFGALIRTGLKGGSDLVAWVTRKTAMGQRLFAPEIMAHAADKAFMAQVKAQPDMQLPPIGPLGGTDTAMLAQNVNPPCNDCDKQKGLGAPPPPPPPASPPLYTPPAAPPAADPPAARSNGVGANLSGRLYNPNLRD